MSEKFTPERDLTIAQQKREVFSVLKQLQQSTSLEAIQKMPVLKELQSNITTLQQYAHALLEHLNSNQAITKNTAWELFKVGVMKPTAFIFPEEMGLTQIQLWPDPTPLQVLETLKEYGVSLETYVETNTSGITPPDISPTVQKVIKAYQENMDEKLEK